MKFTNLKYAFGLFLLPISLTVFAQEDSTKLSDVEEVVVVGSQIKGAKITGALPVSVFSGKDIEALGVDGIKTGHTNAGGYGVMISAVRDGRRVIVVLNGTTSKEDRKNEAEHLTDWALRAYGNYSLFRAGQVIEHAPVWLGQEDSVPLVAQYGLRMTLPRHTYENLRAQVNYRSPIPAPVQVGAEIGTLILSGPGIDPEEIPVIAGASVDSVGRLERVSTGIRYIVFGLAD